MIELKIDSCSLEDKLNQAVSISFHPSFHSTHQKLKRWLDRFFLFIDESIINDLILFYSLAKKKYLDHRQPDHFSRLILSIYQIQRKLISAATLFSSIRHLSVRWIPTNVLFPFFSKPVLGCLIGFNVMDRCELFDEENILVALQKHFPDLQFVKESYYSHTSQHDNIRICYFEVEKKNGEPFTLAEKKHLKTNFKEKLRNSIQKLIPSMFMKLNQEEVYKNILILSQEITSTQDLPQVYITLDQHTGKEIAFHITLVQIAPFHRFSFKERIFGCNLVIDRVLPVRHLDGHQIEAYLFRLLFPYESSLLRSDGSLNFYAARQKVTAVLSAAIGEFRDYNGGLLIKQQEQLFSFKNNLPKEALQDPELMETFFHSLVPLEKQALLEPTILSTLFTYFLKHLQEELRDPVSYQIHQEGTKTYLLIRSNDVSMTDVITSVLRNYLLNKRDWAYNLLETQGGVSFSCVLINESPNEVEPFIQSLQKPLHLWSQKRQNQQNLRIALGHSMYSLDPRVGGEMVSSEILKLLFEGLTRFNEDGHVENAVAESIEVSPDLKQYTFKLRPSLWNDGSHVSAHDFAYSWKRILSPDFKTSFAAYFYPIKNAKEAKEGKVSSEAIGVHVINDRTLQIDLVRPTPYFLHLLTLPIFSPIHRFIDHESPQWPYQAGAHYPCNGPFQLKINQPNRAYQLIKNPLYWEASQVQLDQITLTSMDMLQALHAFHKNEIDWVGNPFGVWHPHTVPEDEGRIVYSNNSLCWLAFNTLISPFKNHKIRRALSLSIDRPEFIKDVLLPWTPAYSVLFPHHCEREHAVFPHFNKEIATSLLEEGLSEIGLTKNKISIQLTFPQKSVLESVALFLKHQFQTNLGIECRLQSLSWNSQFKKMSDGQFQIALVNWATPINDPIGTLNAFKFAKDGVNFSRWEAADFQNLLDLSEEEMNPFQRSKYLFKAEEILAQSTPVVPLFYQPEQAMIRNNFNIKTQQDTTGFIDLARSVSKRR